MTKPSLMEIVANYPIVRFNSQTGKRYNIGARDFIRKIMLRDNSVYNLSDLSDITSYVSSIASTIDIQAINHVHSTTQTIMEPSEALYASFKETPLYKTLQQLQGRKIVLENLLDEDTAIRVADEIRAAVASGFVQDIQAFTLKGMAGYCTLSIPLLIQDTHIHRVLQCNSKSAELQKTKKITQRMLLIRCDDALEALKNYFMWKLLSCTDFNSLTQAIDFVFEYKTTLEGHTDLASVLSQIEYNEIILCTLYKRHGSQIFDIYNIKISMEKIMKHLTNCTLEQFLTILDILHHEDIDGYATGVIECILSRKIFCITDGQQKFQPYLIRIFETQNELFLKLAAMPWEYIRNILFHVTIGENQNILEAILNYPLKSELFADIVRNCSSDTLVGIANITFVKADGLHVRICNKMNDPAVSLIILQQLDKFGCLAKIHDIKSYMISAFVVDQKFVLNCALKMKELESLLNGNIDENVSICEYIFSGRFEVGNELFEIIKRQFGVMQVISMIFDIDQELALNFAMKVKQLQAFSIISESCSLDTICAAPEDEQEDDSFDEDDRCSDMHDYTMYESKFDLSKCRIDDGADDSAVDLTGADGYFTSSSR